MITYLKGDATKPIGEGRKIIPHVVNDIGAWGAGFVLALSKRWPKTRKDYIDWYKNGGDAFALGKIHSTLVENGEILVVHMCAQHDVGLDELGKPPIRYDALENCLESIAKDANPGDSIHGPRFGSGLSCGNWQTIEKLINKHWKDIPVFIYDL